MYHDPYLKPSAAYQEGVNKINEEIDKEKQSEKPDNHRIMRLEEQKLMQQMFSGDGFGAYAKYQSPW